LKQEGGLLGAIYRIPESHPIHYIHLYAPRCRFDAFEFDAFDPAEGSWLFMSKDHGYIGFWSSLPLEPWTGVNADCEYRIYGDDIACICVCGGREYASPAAFKAHCRALSPAFSGGVLRAGGFQLNWT